MTRGDFILGVLTSLIATILYELARKLYPRLQNISVIELGRRLLRIIAVQNLSIRILSPSIALVIAFFVLVNLPPQTVCAPNQMSETRVSKFTYSVPTHGLLDHLSPDLSGIILIPVDVHGHPIKAQSPCG